MKCKHKAYACWSHATTETLPVECFSQVFFFFLAFHNFSTVAPFQPQNILPASKRLVNYHMLLFSCFTECPSFTELFAKGVLTQILDWSKFHWYVFSQFKLIIQNSKIIAKKLARVIPNFDSVTTDCDSSCARGERSLILTGSLCIGSDFLHWNN